MKKILALTLALLALLSLPACGEKSDEARQGSGNVSVSSTVDQILEEGARAAEDAAGTSETAPSEAAVSPTPVPAESPAPAESESAPAEETPPVPSGEIDVDLTQMSSTMIYSQVLDMLTTPENYLGQTVRMAGQCASTYYDVTDLTYHAIIIADATACCAQGIEYVLSGGDYPADSSEAIVTGTFGTYEEFGRTYVYLADAVLGA